MAWVAIGGSVAGAVVSGAMSKGGGGGGGGGSSGAYTPGHLASADDNWQNSYQNSYNLADAAYHVGVPAYDQSYGRQMGLNWDPYLQRAGQAGDAYGATGDAAMGQMGQYGQQAQTAIGQQGAMYDASGRVLNTAFDPQNALYDRTRQQMQDQVRAGQAARGLGDSAAGAGEEDQAMSNFNIDWQNAQLGRQATGIQAAGTAQNAGIGQGRMAGADMSAGLAAGSAGAGYYGQAGSVPMQMQQQWAAAPGQAASQLQGGYANLQQGYGTVAGEAIPYMNQGNGALATQWQNNYQTNRDAAAGMGQVGQAVGRYVQQQAPQWFGGQQQGPQQSYDPSGYSSQGGDTYYGAGQNWGI